MGFQANHGIDHTGRYLYFTFWLVRGNILTYISKFMAKDGVRCVTYPRLTQKEPIFHQEIMILWHHLTGMLGTLGWLKTFSTATQCRTHGGKRL